MTSLQSPRKPPNSCRNCGATSYGPIIARDQTGALRSTGQYRCTGCDLVFVDRSEWRSGASTDRRPEERGNAG